MPNDITFESLLHVPCTDSVTVGIELTSQCNLRCVYCVQSGPQPHHAKEPMSEATIDRLMGLLSQSPVPIWMNGYGETTLHERWTDVAATLLKQGHRLSMVTNLAKPMEWEEALALARFSHLNVSIDSAEPRILREVRRSADLRTIVHNLVQIRAAALSLGTPPPTIEIICVVTPQTLPGLERLVVLAAALGVRRLYVTDVYELDRTPAAAGLAGAADRAALGRVVEAGRTHGVAVDLSCFGNETGKAASHAGTGPRTRNCLEPWNYVMFRSGGETAPCCMPSFRTGSSEGARALEDVLNAEPTVALRRGLLTGELDPLCAACTRYPMVPAGEFQARVREHVDAARGRAEALRHPLAQHRLEVVATGRRNPRAQGCEVWLDGLYRGDGSRVDAACFALDAGWELRDGVPLSHQGQPATLRWSGELRGGAELRLVSHAWSGIVEVRWDDTAQTVDLYAEQGGTRAVKLAAG